MIVLLLHYDSEYDSTKIYLLSNRLSIEFAKLSMPGFEHWKVLPLDRSTYDRSVVDYERRALTDTDGNPITRSLFGKMARRSSTGRVKLLSCLDHLYLFRVSEQAHGQSLRADRCQ